MRKILAAGLFVVFALSFVVGVMTSTSQARPKIPCTYRCINQDWYLCCLCNPPTLIETCEFVQYMCEYPIYDPGINPCD